MTDPIALKHRPVEKDDEPRYPRDPRWSADLTDSEIAELREVAPIAPVTDYVTDRCSEMELERHFEEEAWAYDDWLERL